MTAWLLANAAEEGRNVITGMLVVGLVFIVVIALGELSRAVRHRRRSHEPLALGMSSPATMCSAGER